MRHPQGQFLLDQDAQEIAQCEAEKAWRGSTAFVQVFHDLGNCKKPNKDFKKTQEGSQDLVATGDEDGTQRIERNHAHLGQENHLAKQKHDRPPAFRKRIISGWPR